MNGATANTDGIWPQTILQWRCPSCGMVMDGRNYNLDRGRKKCSKLWHKMAATPRTYALVDESEES